MARDNDRTRLFTRRALLVAGAQAGLFSLLAGRIYYFQILQGDKYQTLAEENRINLRLIAPPRGQILDRNGTPMAINQQNYRVVLLPEQVEKLGPLLDKISDIVPLSDADRKRIERDFRGVAGLNAIMVRDNLTWDQVSALSLRALDLAGTDIEVGEVRTYPYTDVTAHIVGYVGSVATSELAKEEPELTIPGFRIGKNGIEKQYDTQLRGEPGNLQLEVNAHGRVVRELARDEPVVGKDTKLTIDIGLQQYIQQRLSQEESAAAVVMDIHTGAIHALSSHPSFDPNLFTYGISQPDWDRLNNDEHTPLLNKVVSGVYAPGSTFKIITALAALDAGIIKADTPVFCPGYLELGDHKFHCWKHGGHGTVTLISALAGSCDTFFYEIGKRVGIDKIQAMAKRFGLGARTGIDIPHERSGLIPGRSWKMAARGKPWQQGETLVCAIGQGYVVATPMQLALMGARLANGGFAVKPHILKQDGAAKTAQDLWEPMGMNPDHLRLVRDGLFAVVNQPIGTAYAARAQDPALTMAGKTGTAQVRRISMAERESGVLKNEQIAWKERDHALFVGYAPVETPRFVAAAVIEHGGSGAHIAAPVVRDILIEAQKRIT